MAAVEPVGQTDLNDTFGCPTCDFESAQHRSTRTMSRGCLIRRGPKRCETRKKTAKTFFTNQDALTEERPFATYLEISQLLIAVHRFSGFESPCFQANHMQVVG